MRYLLQLVMAMCVACLLKAQEISVDSAKTAYENEKNDSAKIKKGVYYSYLISKTDLTSALLLLNQLKEYCIEKKMVSYYPGIAAEEGNIYYEKGDYIKSIVSCEQSLREYESAPVNKVTLAGKAWAFMWAGLSYSLINDWENAQLNLQASVDASEKAKDTCRLVNSNMNLAYIFYDMQAWDRMYEILLKNQRFLPGCNSYEIGLMTTSSLAIACSKLNKEKEAEQYLKIAETYLGNNITSSLEIFYYAAKAEQAIMKKKGDEAVKNYLLAIELARKTKDPYYDAFTTEGLGRAYLLAGARRKGEEFLLLGLELAKKNNFMAQQQKVLQQLMFFYESQDNTTVAYRYSTDLLRLNDSLAGKINTNRRLLLDARFETGKKESLISQLETEKEIQKLALRQKNILNSILIGSAIIILVIALLGYRNYRQKQRLQQLRISELETEKKLTATEAVLKGEEQERTRLAKDLHDGLGGMLAGIKYSLNTMKGSQIMTPENTQAFERSMDMLDSSIKEMRRVAHNMMPETLVKFGLDTALNDFCNDINQSGALKITYQSIGLEHAAIEQTTAITIYRIVQELITNTMKHASADTAIVQVTKTDGLLSVTVEDDGQGFDPVILHQSKGIGWSNIQHRIDFLKGKLDVNSQPGKGTSVLIEFNT